ncbi:hypothetical protein [Streptomyces sp. TLI_185]|uniref:hypothetical protein n=1 Tax=Streptomyces sp. TLI_185 TaxID=2485151 RepID=UPI000F51596A|nr:hypothetical protein [Streptomyces sp. TLI_185]RPF35740.1 hypothetical protein EDD92_5760 [Streptomyces sp. TLI_185]
MSGPYGYDDGRSGSGPEREPSEERGQAAWAAQQPATPPPWSSAETQAGQAPPPWAFAPTHTGGVLPPTWPPPPPPANPGRRARRVLAVLTATLVLGAGSGAGAWYLTRDHAHGTGAAPATSAGVTVTTTPPPSPTPTPTPTASASLLASSSPSAGYRHTQDPVGYGIDVPQGWTRREKQGKLAPVVFYDAPADGRQLQIFEVTESTPYESLTLAETDPGYGFAAQPGYRVVERDRGDTWAELVYRYDDEEKGARQVIDHRFRAVDGTLYAIRSSGPAELDPELVRGPLAMAVRYFCPAGADCS